MHSFTHVFWLHFLWCSTIQRYFCVNRHFVFHFVPVCFSSYKSTFLLAWYSRYFFDKGTILDVLLQFVLKFYWLQKSRDSPRNFHSKQGNRTISQWIQYWLLIFHTLPSSIFHIVSKMRINWSPQRFTFADSILRWFFSNDNASFSDNPMFVRIQKVN